MAVYAIISKTGDGRVRVRLEQHYRGKSYYWFENVLFLETTDSPLQIADKLGVAVGSNRRAMAEAAGVDPPEHEDPLQHVAILMLAPSYWGHTDAALWEWLKTSFEGDA